MDYKIKCDKMRDWNYDTCLHCKHFTLRISPMMWKCKINNGHAELRAFWQIWASEFLRAQGIEMRDDDISIEYIER